jgi:hypothetical protein
MIIDESCKNVMTIISYKTRPKPPKKVGRVGILACVLLQNEHGGGGMDSSAVGVFTHINVTQMMMFPSLVLMLRYSCLG